MWEIEAIRRSVGTIIHGDAIQEMMHLEDGSVDMVLCDLPYGTTQNKWDFPLPLDLLWKEWQRVCKVHAAIVLFAQSPFDKILGVSNLPLLRYEWIWHKTETTGHLNAGRAPMKAHENILVFYRRQPIYNPQKTTGHPRKTATADCAKKMSECYGVQRGITHYDSTVRFPRDVITYSTDKQHSTLHPTQKPVALCEYLIRTYTNPGQCVLDCCLGSGTTAVACVNTNRNFIGIEKEEKYVAISKERVRALHPTNGTKATLEPE